MLNLIKNFPSSTGSAPSPLSPNSKAAITPPQPLLYRQTSALPFPSIRVPSGPLPPSTTGTAVAAELHLAAAPKSSMSPDPTSTTPISFSSPQPARSTVSSIRPTPTPATSFSPNSTAVPDRDSGHHNVAHTIFPSPATPPSPHPDQSSASLTSNSQIPAAPFTKPELHSSTFPQPIVPDRDPMAAALTSSPPPNGRLHQTLPQCSSLSSNSPSNRGQNSIAPPSHLSPFLPPGA